MRPYTPVYLRDGIRPWLCPNGSVETTVIQPQSALGRHLICGRYTCSKLTNCTSLPGLSLAPSRATRLEATDPTHRATCTRTTVTPWACTFFTQPQLAHGNEHGIAKPRDRATHINYPNISRGILFVGKAAHFRS